MERFQCMLSDVEAREAPTEAATEEVDAAAEAAAAETAAAEEEEQESAEAAAEAEEGLAMVPSLRPEVGAGALVAEEEASSGEESGSSSGAEEEEGGVEEGEEEAAAEAGMGVWPKPLSRWASVESRGRARLRRVNRRLRRAEAAVLRQYAAWDLTQDASEQSAGVPSRLL